MKQALAEDSQNFSVGGRAAITGLTSLGRTGCLHEGNLARDSHCMRRFIMQVLSPMFSGLSSSVCDLYFAKLCSFIGQFVSYFIDVIAHVPLSTPFPFNSTLLWLQPRPMMVPLFYLSLVLQKNWTICYVFSQSTLFRFDCLVQLFAVPP